MTPDQLRSYIAIAHWSLRDLADILDLDPRLVRRWGTGQVEIPWDVETWLEAVAAFHINHPPPLRPLRPLP